MNAREETDAMFNGPRICCDHHGGWADAPSCEDETNEKCTAPLSSEDELIVALTRALQDATGEGEQEWVRALLPVVRAYGDQRAAEQSREAAERAVEAIRRVEEALDALSRETGAYEAGYKGWAQQVIRDVRRAIHGADHGAVTHAS